MSVKAYQNPNQSEYNNLRKEHIKCSKFPRNVVSKGKIEDIENELRMLINTDINSFNVDAELFLNDEFYRGWMCAMINGMLERMNGLLRINATLNFSKEFRDTICPTTDEYMKQFEDEMHQKVLLDIDETKYTKLIEMKAHIDELIGQLRN
ncbi:hypothetical protein V7O61_06505 [Methanolobus sp. WCC1]|uniref:hypothetical protein n=1 Tax=unclassified Methanolobus TaxID=2629569 RepID=UPI00324A3BBF